MATGRKGKDIIILIDGTACGGERNVVINRTASMLDTTAKADYPDRTKLPGWNDSSLTLDGVVIPDDTSEAAILAAYEAQSGVTLSEQDNGSVIYTATAYISNISKNGDKESEATWSVSFEISGGWTAA